MKETNIDVSPWSLLLWPVALPAGGFMFLLEQIQSVVNEELYDPETVRRRLLELQMRYEMGGIEDEEYQAEWIALTDRLDELSRARDSDTEG